MAIHLPGIGFYRLNKQENEPEVYTSCVITLKNQTFQKAGNKK